MKDNILEDAFSQKDYLISVRREIHKYPELSFEEERTSSFIAREMQKFAIPVKKRVAKTGVVGILNAKGKKTIALRADMDALPIYEKTNFSYRSKNPGVMHACGHDAHIACLLGAAKILSNKKESLLGNVKFIFQPSEETPPGGAKLMIQEGVLENPRVDAVLGMHVDTTIPTGKIGFRKGVMLAHVDNFEIEIKGKGGHGAYPHKSVDSVVISSYVIQALQTISSRSVDPLSPVVITIGSIEGGTKHNIIPDVVKMKGTYRSLDKTIAKELPQKIKRIANGVAKSFGADCFVYIEPGYPSLVNDENFTEFAIESARELLGSKAIVEIKEPMMVAEDFSYFLKKRPGTFIRLGVRNEKKKSIHPWHHSQFTVDEDALPIGTAVLIKIAIDFLRKS